MTRRGVVIVGAGQAGIQLADSLRQEGYTGLITVVGDEAGLPYQRPPLSKEFLKDPNEMPDALPLRGSDFYTDNNIELLAPARVVSIDRGANSVILDDGSTLGYYHLVLATGVRNRKLDVPGAEAAGVVNIRTHEDAQRVWNKLGGAKAPVVIGAGFIGLEFAAAAASRGLPVVVLASSDRPMRRSLTPETSKYFKSVLPIKGIDIRYRQDVAEIMTDAQGHVNAVALASGEVLQTDLVVVAVGVIPNDDLATAAGLEAHDGILVDEYLATDDPCISALGDCASYPSIHAGQIARLESVQNASDQAKFLARRITTGKAGGRYSEVPWFWSHQGDIRLNMVGISRPDLQTVIRGDMEAGKFSVFGFDDETLVCVESVNASVDHMAARRILSSGNLPSKEQIMDPDFDLKSFSKKAPVTAG
ncbi:FAD-dependent oxidoreductase (plasmid) [Arthrobacter sp. D3-18]